MSTTIESPVYRSEAFAEDVLDLVSAAPAYETPSAPIRGLTKAPPVAVAPLGVAFAGVPPLS